jgi:outer membrane lipoprotein-sorting protein
MSMSTLTRRRARYLVPLGAAAITAIVVVAPQAASGAQHPKLPARTAGQLLTALEQAHTPQFTGTTVETARLGLPSLSANDLPAGVSAGAQSQLAQIVTLLTGSHTSQIAYGGPTRQRVAIFLSDLSETDIVHNGRNLWTYSSDGNSVTHSTLQPGDDETAPEATTPVDPTRSAEQALAKISPSTAVTVDRTAQVAGRSAYQLDLAPRDSRTLIGSVRIALDAKTSMPLRVQIWSRKDTSSPAFEVGFTSLSMKAPSPSTFAFVAPPRSTTESSPFSESTQPGARPAAGHADSTTVIGKGWTSVFVDQLSAAGPPSPPQPQLQPPSPSPSPSSRPSAPSTARHVTVREPDGGLNQLLDEFSTPVAGGHLVTTSLLSVFITKDNRVLIGAVSPQYLEHLAATGAGR